MVNHC